MKLSIDYRSNERMFVAGRSGMGKTFLIKQLLSRWPNVVVYDEKGELTLDNAKVINSVSALASSDSGRFIMRPPIEAISDKKTRDPWLDKFFWTVYQRKNCILWIDEVYAVAESALKTPTWLKAILTRGRERNTGVIALTQRPAFIPRFFMSEANHYIQFNLRFDDDKNTMRQFVGDLAFTDLKKYEFVYYNDDLDDAVKLKLFNSGGVWVAKEIA